MLCPEKFLEPVPCEVLCHVVELAPSIVPFPRVTLRILVGHDRAHGLEHCTADHVLGGNQLQAVTLAFHLFPDYICYFRIRGGQIGHV